VSGREIAAIQDINNARSGVSTGYNARKKRMWRKVPSLGLAALKNGRIRSSIYKVAWPRYRSVRRSSGEGVEKVWIRALEAGKEGRTGGGG